MDGSGSHYAPSIVRVGVNAHHSVQVRPLDRGLTELTAV
jgi:hypothetical protein